MDEISCQNQLAMKPIYGKQTGGGMLCFMFFQTTHPLFMSELY